MVLPGWGHLGVGINHVRDSQSVVRGLVSSIIYAAIWQHSYFSFWHKLIIWYWISNYPVEYKPDITSLGLTGSSELPPPSPFPGRFGRVFWGWGGWTWISSGECLDKVLPGPEESGQPSDQPSFACGFLWSGQRRRNTAVHTADAAQTRCGAGSPRPVHLFLVYCSQALCTHEYVLGSRPEHS